MRVVLSVEDVGDELEAHPLEVSDAEMVVVGVREVSRVVVGLPRQFQEPVYNPQIYARARTNTREGSRGVGWNETRSQTGVTR